MAVDSIGQYLNDFPHPTTGTNSLAFRIFDGDTGDNLSTYGPNQMRLERGGMIKQGLSCSLLLGPLLGPTRRSAPKRLTYFTDPLYSSCALLSVAAMSTLGSFTHLTMAVLKTLSARL